MLFVPILRRGGIPMDANASTMTGTAADSGAAAAEEPPIHILWINAGLSCDGDSVSLTAATQPSIEEIALQRAARAAQDRRPLAADRLRVRPGAGRGHLHRVVLQGRARRARPVRPGRRGLDPQRVDQARGLLVRLRRRPGDRPADHHQRVDRPARPQGAGRGRHRHLRDLRRHPRDGGQPHRRHGRAGLPGLGLEVARRASRSSACPAARSSRTTSPRRWSTCSTRRPAPRR